MKILVLAFVVLLLSSCVSRQVRIDEPCAMGNVSAYERTTLEEKLHVWCK